MKKFDTYMVNKIFTVPYLDRMISEDSIPDSFFEYVRRYVKTDDATIGEAISEIYHFMNYEYRNEYYYKNTILNQLLIKKHDKFPYGKPQTDEVARGSGTESMAVRD